MGPVLIFMLGLGIVLLLIGVCVGSAWLLKHRASDEFKERVKKLASSLRKRLTQSRLMLVLQDMSVLVKSLFASITICLLIPTGAECKLEAVAYLVQDASKACNVTHSRLWPSVTALRSACQPDDSQIYNLRQTLYFVIASNMALFVVAIGLRHTRRLKFKTWYGFVVTKLALLFAVMKIGLVMTVGKCTSYYGCDTPGFQHCKSKSLAFSLLTLDPLCCGYRFPGVVYGSTVIRKCTTDVPFECSTRCTIPSVPTEVYILMLNNLLTFMYISYLMNNRAEQEKSHQAQPPAVCATEDGTCYELMEPNPHPGQQEGPQVPLLASKQDQDQEEPELKPAPPETTSVWGPLTVAGGAPTDSAKKKMKYRLLRNLAAFAKYLLTVITLSLLINDAKNIVDCSSYQSDLVQIQASTIKTTCDVSIDTYPYNGLFIAGSFLGSGSFLYGTVLATTGRNPENSALIATGTAGLQVMAVAIQFASIMHLRGMPTTFLATANPTHSNVVTVIGDVKHKTITSAELGITEGKEQLDCGVYCGIRMNWSVSLLLCNMILSVCFMGLNLIEYHMLAKKILAARALGEEQGEDEAEAKAARKDVRKRIQGASAVGYRPGSILLST
eukprot:TRINITY_DN10567_c0_g1_i10.p1 TRINITY_DN10567_c0_g1~~TRINITY_DN10567_c0_g1_i10.p1  ORF type:complete len:613 (+),score=132.51 TRINITY_DN10567_c0_g1_i10:74-1912(+)